MDASLVHEQVRIRRQPVTEVDAGERGAPAQVKRRDAPARLQKGKLAWSDNTGIEARGHGYFAVLAWEGGHGVSGRARRYVHIARDRPR